MQQIFVSYSDCETGNNFDLSRKINSHEIGAALNVLVDVLRLMGYGDSLISDFIGDTYFPVEDVFECCKQCGE